MSYPVFKPLTYAYNCISTGDSYTLSKEIATASDFYGLNSNRTDSHQMKNSEWGAVAYLTQSSCGRNGTEVTMNSKNLNNNSKRIYAVTGYSGEKANGIDASTTNNMSGIFDLRGCVWEYTTGYITNGNDNLKYGSSFVATTEANENGYQILSTEYATVYPYQAQMDGIQIILIFWFLQFHFSYEEEVVVIRKILQEILRIVIIMDIQTVSVVFAQYLLLCNMVYMQKQK